MQLILPLKYYKTILNVNLIIQIRYSGHGGLF